MSSRTRNYVPPNGVMFRAAAYDKATGECVRSAGPYSTRGPAMAARSWLWRPGRRVVVESCQPVWQEIDGTELDK